MTQPYRLTDNAVAAAAQPLMRESDGAWIPNDPRNADYQVATAWLAVAGNSPDPTPTVTPPAPTLTFLQFMALFTTAEQAAIVNSADTQTRLFMMMATGAGTLQLGNAEVIAGVNYLATPPTASPPGPGLITTARAAAILANQAPPPS